MSDERGLYGKFVVSRTDRSTRHRGCDYFVLDLTHDTHAPAAIAAYAAACEGDRPQLAADLRRKLADRAATPDATA